jgi:uncharacterized membrane protein
MDDTPVAGHWPKHRIEALSDGVYAIAMTLLVLELKLPALPQPAGADALAQALVEQTPRVLSWLLSFFVLALFWVGQHRLLALARAVDSAMLRVELLHLALVSLFPFTTALIGEHGLLPAAAVLYAAHLGAMSVLALLRVRYLVVHPALQHAGVDPGVLRELARRAVLLMAASLLAFVLGFWWPAKNMLAMLLPLVGARWARR